MLTPEEKKIIDKTVFVSEFEAAFLERKNQEARTLKTELEKYIDQKNLLCDLVDKIDAKEISLSEKESLVLKEVCSKVVRDNLVNIQNLKLRL